MHFACPVAPRGKPGSSFHYDRQMVLGCLFACPVECEAYLWGGYINREP